MDHDKGYTGLVNLGNTCFMNASLQILNHTYELKEIVTKTTKIQKNISTSPASVIFYEWTDLQKLMISNNGIVSPNKFVHHVQTIAASKNLELFTGWAQNDLPEFLLFLIDCFHTTLARKTKRRMTKSILRPKLDGE